MPLWVYVFDGWVVCKVGLNLMYTCLADVDKFIVLENNCLLSIIGFVLKIPMTFGSLVKIRWIDRFSPVALAN